VPPKKTGAHRQVTAVKKERTRWPFPRATLEEALKIPYAIKEHNGGNPWESDEVRKAIGAGTGANAYFYLTAASRDYGLTIGTSTAERIALADLGRNLVYAPNSDAERTLKVQAFLSVDIFKRVLEYYKGSNLPEMKYLGNVLQKEFGLAPDTHEEFSRTFRENCQYLKLPVPWDHVRHTNHVWRRGRADNRHSRARYDHPRRSGWSFKFNCVCDHAVR
jgi:hypothetical protein